MGGFGHRFREQFQGSFGEGSSQEIIALLVQVDVFEEKLLSRNPVRGALRKPFRGIHPKDIPAGVTAGDLLQDLVEPGVGAETERIEIARLRKRFPGGLAFSQSQLALAHAEVQLGVLTVDLRRLPVEFEGFFPFPGGLKSAAGVVEVFPGREDGVAQTDRMERGERRAVPQIAGDGTEEDLRSRVSDRKSVV